MLRADVPVALVASDRPCEALRVAAASHVPTSLLDRRSFGGFTPSFDRLAYTRVLTDVLTDASIDVVAMAGFGTVLDQPVHDAFAGRIVNTHPALLPAFPGWHAVEAALEAGAKVTGCTVHLATLEMDAGPILAQEAVAVQEGDTVESLHERIKEVERRLYPATLLQVLGRLEARAGMGQ